MLELLRGNPDLQIAFVAMLSTVLLASIVLVATVTVVQPNLRLKRRLAIHGLLGESAAVAGSSAAGNIRQRRIQERLQELEEGKKETKTRRNQIRLDLLQAGVEVNVKRYILLSLLAGIVAGAVSIPFLPNPIMAIPIGLIAALGLPKFVLKIMARNRQKAFTANFANAIDVLIRGMKSGLPVGECLAINGREAPDPVGEEFRLLVEGQKIGLDREELLSRGVERIPTSEYRFFSIVLVIQEQTGGNLASTLENLANVLRERKRLRDKVKALSSEAKSSALIIGSLPFIVTALLGLISPEYIGLLFKETIGTFIIVGGLAWMAIGVLVMRKMINFKV